MTKTRPDYKTALDRVFGDIDAAPTPPAPTPAPEPDYVVTRRKRRRDYRGPQPYDAAAMAERYGAPFTYRLPPELGERMKRTAAAHGLRIADLAAAVIEHGLDAYDAGEITVA